MTTNTQYQATKGDNTASFGRDFITITVYNPQHLFISKIVVVTNGGCSIKNKVFADKDNFQKDTVELLVNYDSSETVLFNNVNIVRVVAFDSLNRQYTCPESLVFNAKNGVITGYGK